MQVHSLLLMVIDHALLSLLTHGIDSLKAVDTIGNYSKLLKVWLIVNKGHMVYCTIFCCDATQLRGGVSYVVTHKRWLWGSPLINRFLFSFSLWRKWNAWSWRQCKYIIPVNGIEAPDACYRFSYTSLSHVRVYHARIRRVCEMGVRETLEHEPGHCAPSGFCRVSGGSRGCRDKSQW